MCFIPSVCLYPLNQKMKSTSLNVWRTRPQRLFLKRLLRPRFLKVCSECFFYKDHDYKITSLQVRRDFWWLSSSSCSPAQHYYQHQITSAVSSQVFKTSKDRETPLPNVYHVYTMQLKLIQPAFGQTLSRWANSGLVVRNKWNKLNYLWYLRMMLEWNPSLRRSSKSLILGIVVAFLSAPFNMYED